MIVERSIKLVTEQHNIPKPSPMPEFPMKEWTVKIYLLDQAGGEHPASCFTKVTYNLHPSFEDKTHQTFVEPPFSCTNEGWGEFEMSIDLFTTEKGGKTTVYHDLNFQSPTYEVIQPVTFKNPSQALLNTLRATGPIPNEEEAKTNVKSRKTNDAKKKKAVCDFEKMADAMTKLNEEDLLHVIQMIHDYGNEDTYTKNDIDNGEFTVDLYTLPDNLAKMIWEYLVEIKSVS
ncbi:SAS complex, SAS5 subunit/transcription initiation factor IID, subunit 14 [Jackrogersella minutella]|nr:SAS complex, SAS5 subunit/transcription initiation factor IID, subunit 14 [Jackrogersella minutella]